MWSTQPLSHAPAQDLLREVTQTAGGHWGKGGLHLQHSSARLLGPDLNFGKVPTIMCMLRCEAQAGGTPTSQQTRPTPAIQLQGPYGG